MPAATQDPKTFPPPWNYLIPLAKRSLIWGAFFALLWVLRHFLPLVFLTFVFGYVAEHGVEGLSHRISSRRTRTAIVFVVMIAVMGLLLAFLGPELKDQAFRFRENLPKLQKAVDTFLERQRESYEFMRGLLEGVTAENIFAEIIGRAGVESATEKLHLNAQLFFGVFKNAAAVTTTFLMSLLFAFLVVADLPRMSRGVQSLRQTRLSPFYDEVSRTVFRFAQVLGRFLEAQLVIAIINTVLTAIGMTILGIPQKAFLAGVVFLCSFIPVAGVFVSTFPICLVALDASGIGLVVWVIVMVSVVHTVEAYVMNPLIFGAHLKMNPVLVLAVLLIGHQLFGIWGLLLGVPSVTYFFGYAIRHAPDAQGPSVTK